MCTLIISDVLATQKNLPDAGNVLYEKIKIAIETNDKVIVDMQEVAALPSIFLNMSLGRIIEDFGIEALKGKLSFKNITKTQAERVKDYLNRFVPKEKTIR